MATAAYLRLTHWLCLNSRILALTRCQVRTGPAPFAKQMGQALAILSSLEPSACLLVRLLPSPHVIALLLASSINIFHIISVIF